MQLELGTRDMQPGRAYRLGREYRAVRDSIVTGTSGGTVTVDPDVAQVVVHAVGELTNTIAVPDMAPPVPRHRLVVKLRSKGGAGAARVEFSGRAATLEAPGEAIELVWGLGWHVRRVQRPGA